MLGLLLAQVGLDLVAGLRGHHQRQPVRLGRLVFLGGDLHDVAVAQLFADRHGAAVDPSAHARRSERGVDVEGEVEERGPLGEFAQVAVGREDEDFARRGLGVETLRQRVGRVLYQFAQMSQPHFAGLRPLVDALVTPVRGDASLGHGVHAFGADLHLDPAAFGRHGGVQRLVAVRLGDRDPVAHALGIGRVEVRHHRIGRPAELFLGLLRAVDDDADGEDVVDALERDVLFVHLVPDREDRFGAALDVVFDAEAVQPLLDRHEEPPDEGLALLGALFEFCDDVLVILRFEVFQGDVLQLALDRVETQLVGDLGVEVHRLPALLAPLFAGEHFERTHHFEPVGQFDQDDARVFRVAHDQVPEIVGLLLGHLELQLRDVGQTQRDAHDLIAEAFADVGAQGEEFFGGQLLVGEAHHVVQDRRDGGVAAQAHLRDHDRSHRGGMLQQGRAVVAHQSGEFPVGILQRLVDECPGLLREIRAHERAEFFVP